MTQKSRRAIFASTCLLISTTVIYLLPTVEIHVFVRGAAMLVSLFTGSPSFQADAGWILSFPTTTLLISKACSGTGFFIIMCVLFGWHFTDKTQYHMLNLVLAVTVALFLSIFINALRIICLLQAHHWLFPLLPENYSAFAHMLIGVAAFLPTLIALNALLEFYGRKRNI